MTPVATPTRTYQARYVLEGESAQFPLGATVTVGVFAENIGDQPFAAGFDDLYFSFTTK